MDLLRGVWGVLPAGNLWAGSGALRSPSCLSFLLPPPQAVCVREEGA